MGDPSDVDVDQELQAVAGAVVSEQPLPELLTRVAKLAVQVLRDGADEASATLVEMPYEMHIGGSSDAALALDERQNELDRGPCLDAAYGGTHVIVDDMATDERWPAYTPRALELGVRSSLSIALPTQAHVIGAINWYGHRPRAFSEADVESGARFVAKVAVAVTNAHLYNKVATVAAQMQEAMASRAVIEQAKGILMAQRNIGADEAFDLLVRASQRSNRKLREVAAEIASRLGSR